MEGIKLDDRDLESVSGGVTRSIDTHTNHNAVVRSNPGLSYQQVGSLSNKTMVNTTGEYSHNEVDGITWYYINYPVNGWIPGRCIGCPE